MKRRGISPIIATLFLIASAVIVGIAFISWSQGWFTTSARTVELQISGDIVRSSSSAQMNLQIKNVGTSSVTIQKIEVEGATGTITYTTGGGFGTVTVTNPASSPIAFAVSVPLDPGQVVSGYIRANSNTAWKGGATYTVTVTYQDVDTQKTLTETVSIRA